VTRVHDVSSIVELVRLPAVLSVPGDSLLGGAAAGARRHPARTAGLAASSCLLYLAGMALNDYADRDVDGLERPQRPIPSGRVTPRLALRLAQALTAAGVVTAGVAGGRQALAAAAPLAGVIWAYDLALKKTPAGPAAMAACRSLDVLLGASQGAVARAMVPATVVGGHTLSVTLVSRHEASGGAPTVGHRAARAAAAVTAGAAAFATHRLRRARNAPALGTAVAALLAGYASSFGGAALRAAREPTAARLRSVVGAGVLGLMPLEAAMLTAAGQPVTGAAVAGVWPFARRLAGRRSVT